MPQDDVTLRLRRFFAFHEPTQLAVVDQWLKHWEGQHDALFTSLIAYHGAEPPIAYSTTADRPAITLSRQQTLHRECRGLLQQLILYYCPHDILRVDDVMVLWEGQEEELFRRLQRFAAQRDSIFRYFQKYDPQNMKFAVQLTVEWLGAESHLLKYLAAHNGQNPTRTLTFPKLTVPESQRIGVARNRLIALFKEFQPERLEEVDALLEANRGREEEMFGLLHAKYRPMLPPPLTTSSDFVTSDFIWCAQLLAEGWIGTNQAHLEEVEDLLGKLVGTSIAPGEVLLRLSAIVPPSDTTANNNAGASANTSH